MKRKVAVVRNLKQARTYILQVGICGIFSDAGVGMPNLWEVVDLPDRQRGEKGWGQKVVAIWRWKNALPAKGLRRRLRQDMGGSIPKSYKVLRRSKIAFNVTAKGLADSAG